MKGLIWLLLIGGCCRYPLPQPQRIWFHIGEPVQTTDDFYFGCDGVIVDTRYTYVDGNSQLGYTVQGVCRGIPFEVTLPMRSLVRRLVSKEEIK